MRPIPRPTFSVKEVFTTSISRIRDPDLKARLEGCLNEIIIDSDIYDTKATNATLHQISKKTHINVNVTKDEMNKVYTDRMVNKKGPGRNFYEKLRYPNGFDKCPLCGHLPIKTLDHYLAKTDHPSLAVSPNNLVPACNDCNQIKNAATPTCSEEETLHPYFDDIDDEQWLFARVVQTTPVSFNFFIQPPENAPDLLAKRVKYHFELYKLNRLYKSEAATEISDITYQLKSLLNKAGPIAVKKHLSEMAISCLESRKNSWKTAMYEALSNDSWFCNHGISMQS
ncbi:HNH endonuclease [Paenibacillus sp. Y412MC10]|uniref:HNH endonuclease n=1 Tax=Geobacillus sp. (strain Y412MC10) TaxID=481743 RepID=UPI0011AB373A|nr:hypothetical protein [Paenibacillus sp. Y412MC10]